MLRTSIDKIKENGFELTKKRSRRYPAKTITVADYADDIAIRANTPNQAETLLHSLELAAAAIGRHVNAHKTEYMCFNQTGDISTLDRSSLKLVDKFTYLGREGQGYLCWRHDMMMMNNYLLATKYVVSSKYIYLIMIYLHTHLYSIKY